MNSETQTIEQLKERFERLSKAKQNAETELRVADERLRAAKQAAMTAYQTDDLEKLKQMLEEWTAENDRSRLEYQRSLDGIEAELAKIKGPA